jgi:hypothetical protein
VLAAQGSPGHPKKPGVPPNPLAHIGCETGTTFAQAVPADREGDPFLTNWTKPAYNPIVNRTSDDPSSAWKTASGEWRFLGNGKGRGACPIYAAPNLRGPWTSVGTVANFTGGECPSLFPLPRLTPGTSTAPGEQLPSHVFKRGKCPDPQCRLTDKFIIGTFTDGRALVDTLNATAGTFAATPGVPFPCKQEVDNGKTGKDRKVLVSNPCSGDGTDGKVAGDNLVDYGGFYGKITLPRPEVNHTTTYYNFLVFILNLAARCCCLLQRQRTFGIQNTSAACCGVGQ